LIILWAAQANTAPALFWTLFHILSNPDAKEAVLDEYEKMFQKKQMTADFKSNDSNEHLPWMYDILETTKTDVDQLVILGMRK